MTRDCPDCGRRMVPGEWYTFACPECWEPPSWMLPKDYGKVPRLVWDGAVKRWLEAENAWKATQS